MIESPFEKLHPNSLKLNRLLGGIAILVIATVVVLFAAGAFWLGDLTMTERIWSVTAGALLVAFAIFLGWGFPGLAYKNASWKLDANGLEIRRGVWWKHRIVVPHSRVQHSDIEQGPLQRVFSLATLIVNTAGTKGASVQLDGLLFETAEGLRDALTTGQFQIDTGDAIEAKSALPQAPLTEETT